MTDCRNISAYVDVMGLVEGNNPQLLCISETEVLLPTGPPDVPILHFTETITFLHQRPPAATCETGKNIMLISFLYLGFYKVREQLSFTDNISYMARCIVHYYPVPMCFKQTQGKRVYEPSSLAHRRLPAVPCDPPPPQPGS